MKIIIAALALLAGTYALQYKHVTGPTPPPIACPKSLCAGKHDGNYGYANGYGYNAKKDNYFVQCLDGIAYCQACWPLTMKFSERCNQCVYNLNDPCHTTKPWIPEKRYKCPDVCPGKGPHYTGNVADHHNSLHYVGCWKGVTVGCVNCPAPLKFNEAENACLWEGKYVTQPLPHKSKYQPKKY
ncbi:uncharacterized protein LOC130613306 [Hydractinia symbiolongicarpus]|uniref:uncharacterized protein LOC130613306 n=1 Tax=Hydractinia symbiolongicarpus TaxID=13093 RepID=UPI00254F0A6A|nr:uncharacterized protein LOC130613306 [Hydractinia symbiolongicarpus]